MIAPEVFDQDEDDGIVLLLDEAPEAHLHRAVREAASVCPAAAIQLSEPDVVRPVAPLPEPDVTD
jgi:ferredoxin